MVFETLRPRILHLAHHSKMVDHPGRTRMFSNLHRTYYWPLMAAKIASAVRLCPHFARNRLRLILRRQPMRLFTTKQPLESFTVNFLGPSPKTKADNRFIMVMADSFTKLNQVVPLKRKTRIDVAKAFDSHWVFKYGALKDVLSDNGPQFASQLYQNTCRIQGISNTFTSAYLRQKNGKVECFNHSISAMLRCYVSDHIENWDEYAKPITYEYNLSVHRATGTRPLDLCFVTSASGVHHLFRRR